MALKAGLKQGDDNLDVTLTDGGITMVSTLCYVTDDFESIDDGTKRILFISEIAIRNTVTAS